MRALAALSVAVLTCQACGTPDDGLTVAAGTAPVNVGANGASGSADATGTGDTPAAPARDVVPPSTANNTGQTPSGPATPSVCEIHQIGSTRVIPEMLIVLDRSGSMRRGGVNRWDPSVSGLKAITASLQSVIEFGLMAFPGQADCSAITDPLLQAACQLLGAGNDASCEAGSLDVPIALNNAGAIASALDSMAPNGATPTAATLQAAHTFFGGNFQAPDQLSAPKYVLLVTDGAPNCSQGFGGGVDFQAVEQSVAEVASMTSDGIKTFVLGYDTRTDATLSAALNRMAQAGGTGDSAHRAIENEASLIAAFEEIAGAATSCEYALDDPPSDASYVLVELDGAPLTLGDPDGWSLSPDSRRVSLQGQACAAMQGLGQHSFSVSVQCAPVVVQ